MAGGKPPSMGIVEEASERLLVEAAQKDPSRFGELYEHHFELVYAYIVRRVGHRDAAEDLTSAKMIDFLKPAFGAEEVVVHRASPEGLA